MIIQLQEGQLIEISVFHLEDLDLLTASKHRTQILPTEEQLFPVMEEKGMHSIAEMLTQGAGELAP